jgi:hypothetical protein
MNYDSNPSNEHSLSSCGGIYGMISLSRLKSLARVTKNFYMTLGSNISKGGCKLGNCDLMRLIQIFIMVHLNCRLLMFIGIP